MIILSLLVSLYLHFRSDTQPIGLADSHCFEHALLHPATVRRGYSIIISILIIIIIIIIILLIIIIIIIIIIMNIIIVIIGKAEICPDQRVLARSFASTGVMAG